MDAFYIKVVLYFLVTMAFYFLLLKQNESKPILFMNIFNFFYSRRNKAERGFGLLGRAAKPSEKQVVH